MRRVYPNDEAWVWCRKCSGYARCRLGPKLMNRCRPESKDTKEYGKCCLIILQKEECQTEARKDGHVKGKEEESQEESARGQGKNSKLEVSCRKKGSWNIVKKRMLEDRGALPKEEGDLIIEYKAMHDVWRMTQKANWKTWQKRDK